MQTSVGAKQIPCFFTPFVCLMGGSNILRSFQKVVTQSKDPSKSFSFLSFLLSPPEMAQKGGSTSDLTVGTRYRLHGASRPVVGAQSMCPASVQTRLATPGRGV